MTTNLQTTVDMFSRKNVQLRRTIRIQLVLSVLAGGAIAAAASVWAFGEGSRAALPYSLTAAALGLSSAALGLLVSRRRG